MGMWIGRNRKARVTYGFDEIALVPGRVTINPNEVDIAWRLPRRDAEPLDFKIPILASAMDGVVDVRFAIEMSKLGGLAVLNLEGVQTRYKNPQGSPPENCRGRQSGDHGAAPKNLSGTGAGRFDRGADPANQGQRRDRGGQFHSATGRGIRSDRAGSRRGRFRGAKHGLDRPSHFVGI